MSWSWWPENSDGPEHEAWVQPIFGDGELGTGTSCGRGLVQESRYDDHGRLVYERVRPYSEVETLRMVCSCGWTGLPVLVAALPDDEIDRRWMEPTDAGDARFLAEWHAHLAPLKADDAGTCPTCGHRTASRSTEVGGSLRP